MAAHNELGIWGEQQAVDHLERKGYTIVERDWKSGSRDIDIVSIDPDDNSVVFVEVKTRRNRIFGEPEEAIDHFKRQNLIQAINHYVKCKHIHRDIRFDVVSIVGTPESGSAIRHIQDVALL